MTSALKVQEENARLHSIVAAMRTDFGVQLQTATLARANSMLAETSQVAPGKSNKRSIGDSAHHSSEIQAAEGSSNHSAAARKSTTSRHRRQPSSRIAKPRQRVADKEVAAEDDVLDNLQSMDIGGNREGAGHSSQSSRGGLRQGHQRELLRPNSRDTELKGSSGMTPSDVSADTPMDGEQTQQLQQLGGTDSLLDAELPMLHTPAEADAKGSVPRMAAVDPFAASEMLATMPPMNNTAMLASRFDSLVTSTVHDSAFACVPTGASSRSMHTHSSVTASAAAAAVAQVQMHHQGVDSPSQEPMANRRASLPSMHMQQQQGMPWHQQQLQQQILQQQQQQQNGSQLAQCLPPWDQSSFMGGGTSSFMSPPTGLDVSVMWAAQPNVPPMHGSPQPQQQVHGQMQSSQPQHMYMQSRHTWSSAEYQPSVLMSSMSDMGPFMAPHAGADVGYAGAQQQQQHVPSHQMSAHAVPVHQMPLQAAPQQLFPAQSLPAQPGNPFASAMASGQSLAHMRSTSFAT